MIAYFGISKTSLSSTYPGQYQHNPPHIKIYYNIKLFRICSTSNVKNTKQLKESSREALISGSRATIEVENFVKLWGDTCLLESLILIND